jgi:hypothetical protein
MEVIEKPGEFYLGREYDLAAGKVLPLPLLYDSEDLTTHAVCVGMTGSGKTGLCVSLLEEAALNGIPAIAIDPKGDLGNLLLAFPELRPTDFRPWIDESVAARKGITPDQLAEQTAEQWRSGLAEWGEDGNRIERFTKAVDRVVYTPGSSAGLPLTILKSFAAPPREIVDDGDALRDRVDGAASAVLGLLGITVDPVNSREQILLAKIFEEAWRKGESLDLAALIHEIQQPSFNRVGVVDLDSFFPPSARHELGMKLNNLLASPTFATWLEGEPLDVQRLLWTAEGKPRLSILSIAHLGDPERMFFVTMLLNEVISWMRTQRGTGSLRAILYMDEVFGYFPPVANPPSKRPMLTLLKQARAYGLGCVLATQNPVDLDYKGLSNAGTWFLGRLQTERDKRRVVEGLEGASAEAGAAFDRAGIEATLSALDKRVFLMNNVHASAPKVFHSRWAMSYLCGPLTRGQLAKLMAERKGAASANAREGEAPADPSAPQWPRDPQRDPRPEARATIHAALSRPAVTAEITQRYWPVDAESAPKDGERLCYRPALLGVGRLHFVKAADVDVWQEITAMQPVHGELPKPPWNSALLFDRKPLLEETGAADATYGDLPGELAQAKNYRRWDNDLADHLYQGQRLTVWRCEELDERSKPGESEEGFRARAAESAKRQRVDRRDKVMQKYAVRIKRQEDQVARAKARAAEQKSQFWVRILETIGRIAEWVMMLLAGRRSRKSLSTSAGAAMRERSQQSRAEDQLAAAQAELDKLHADEQAELHALDADLDADRLKLEKIEVPPRKSDIAVDEVMLVWAPWWIVEASGAARPAY